MKKLIQLLSGEINVVEFEDGRKLTLISSRDTDDDSKTGFYIDIPLGDGSYQRNKISNQLGYSLLSIL